MQLKTWVKILGKQFNKNGSLLRSVCLCVCQSPSQFLEKRKKILKKIIDIPIFGRIYSVFFSFYNFLVRHGRSLPGAGPHLSVCCFVIHFTFLFKVVNKYCIENGWEEGERLHLSESLGCWSQVFMGKVSRNVVQSSINIRI